MIRQGPFFTEQIQAEEINYIYGCLRSALGQSILRVWGLRYSAPIMKENKEKMYEALFIYLFFFSLFLVDIDVCIPNINVLYFPNKKPDSMNAHFRRNSSKKAMRSTTALSKLLIQKWQGCSCTIATVSKNDSKKTHLHIWSTCDLSCSASKTPQTLQYWHIFEQNHNKTKPVLEKILKLIYSVKATKFCNICPLSLSVCTMDKNTGKILQNFVGFSEYMNFNNLPIIDMDMILWVVMGLIGGSVSLRQEVDRRTDDLGNVPVCPGSVIGLVFSWLRCCFFCCFLWLWWWWCCFLRDSRVFSRGLPKFATGLVYQIRYT